MTTMTLTLTDFLLARIAEDEAVVREARSSEHPADRDGTALMAIDGTGSAAVMISSGRVLAECEAKRRIVERESRWVRQRFDAPEHMTVMPDNDGPPHIQLASGATLHGEDMASFRAEWYEPAPPTATLRDLASIYADHADFRPEWSAS